MYLACFVWSLPILAPGDVTLHILTFSGACQDCDIVLEQEMEELMKLQISAVIQEAQSFLKLYRCYTLWFTTETKTHVIQVLYTELIFAYAFWNSSSPSLSPTPSPASALASRMGTWHIFLDSPVSINPRPLNLSEQRPRGICRTKSFTEDAGTFHPCTANELPQTCA